MFTRIGAAVDLLLDLEPVPVDLCLGERRSVGEEGVDAEDAQPAPIETQRTLTTTFDASRMYGLRDGAAAE